MLGRPSGELDAGIGCSVQERDMIVSGLTFLYGASNGIPTYIWQNGYHIRSDIASLA